MKNQLTLLHFDNPEDLLAGIDALQQHHIVIQEVYSAKPVPGMEAKLNRQQLRLGEMVLRFGCLGGMVFVSLIFYLMQPEVNWKSALLNTVLLLVTLFLAGCLTPVKAPRCFNLQPGDRRYLAVVDTQRIPVEESIAHLFQYAGAVDFNSTIKNIVIS
ncbi:MAG: hypothetical protein JWR67_68 [Mucilaginibacter sp.]|jgi:hypothetical protein|nr:hypothetical protein [Mucilaginibacter sp.]